MKLFIDSADPKEIQTAWDWGFIDGVTTNPSLAAGTGLPYQKIIERIFAIVDGPVNLEVIATDFDGMIAQAEALHALNPNVVVKLPCTAAGLKAAKRLRLYQIKTNITLVFSEAQALLAAKVGATYVSPFLGRLDDLGLHFGDELIARIVKIYRNYDFETQILDASIRDVEHVTRSALLGADVATVPFTVLEQLVDHKLTTQGLEKFLSDWKKSGLKLPI
jgi:transaldolase